MHTDIHSSSINLVSTVTAPWKAGNPVRWNPGNSAITWLIINSSTFGETQLS